MTVTRETVVAAARGWLGTPYHHQASLKSVGCDCLGLIRGVWRELCGPEPEAMPPYTRDWGSATGSETLIEAACRHLEKLADAGMARPGDVVVFRMRDRGVAKHAGILVAARCLTDAHGSRSGRHPEAGAERASKDGRTPHHDVEELRMIHAQEGLGVVEIPLGRWWRRRVVAAFRFPGVGDAFGPLLDGEGGERSEPGGVRARFSPHPAPQPTWLRQDRGAPPSPRWGREN